MEYKVSYGNWWGLRPGGIFRFGLQQGRGTVDVDSATVRLSGPNNTRLSVFFGLFVALVIAFLGPSVDQLGLGRWSMPFILLLISGFFWFAAFMLAWKWEVLKLSVPMEKARITRLRRDGRRISFFLPDPKVAGRTVEVFLKAQTEVEAARIEDELRGYASP